MHTTIPWLSFYLFTISSVWFRKILQGYCIGANHCNRQDFGSSHKMCAIEVAITIVQMRHSRSGDGTCSWSRHQMETHSALLALWAGNSPAIGLFSSQKPMTRSFEFFFDLRLNKRLSKRSRRRWCLKPSRSFWRQRDATEVRQWIYVTRYDPHPYIHQFNNRQKQ